MTPSSQDKWLLVFYTVPSNPVSNRMKLWRKLSKAGAVQLKGSVYILPHSEDHYEFLQWLISEVATMRGDGAFVSVNKVETMDDDEIKALFNQQREREYLLMGQRFEDLSRKVQSAHKGTRSYSMNQLGVELNKLQKDYEQIRGIDFFSSKEGIELGKRIAALGREIKTTSAPASKARPVLPAARRVEDYQGKTWVTRKHPFVDRMASAWLIRRFVDKNARFQFIDERELGGLGKDSVSFDVRGAEFTHVGDLCTFEVLAKVFGIKDKALRKVAEIVHELDTKDDKYANPETSGLEKILQGIKKTATSDADALEKGMEVFEMLYASKN
jgi:hypothetical protein